MNVTQKPGGSYIAWGVFMIGLGLLFLTFEIADIEPTWKIWWRWWPIVMVFSGLTKLVVPSVRQVGSGVAEILFGLWFLACLHHWFGLTFLRSWPLLLIVFGLQAVLNALLRRPTRDAGEEGPHV